MVHRPDPLLNPLIIYSYWQQDHRPRPSHNPAHTMFMLPTGSTNKDANLYWARIAYSFTTKDRVSVYLTNNLIRCHCWMKKKHQKSLNKYMTLYIVDMRDENAAKSPWNKIYSQHSVTEILVKSVLFNRFSKFKVLQTLVTMIYQTEILNLVSDLCEIMHSQEILIPVIYFKV